MRRARQETGIFLISSNIKNVAFSFSRPPASSETGLRPAHGTRAHRFTARFPHGGPFSFDFDGSCPWLRSLVLGLLLGARAGLVPVGLRELRRSTVDRLAGDCSSARQAERG